MKVWCFDRCPSISRSSAQSVGPRAPDLLRTHLTISATAPAILVACRLRAHLCIGRIDCLTLRTLCKRDAPRTWALLRSLRGLPVPEAAPPPCLVMYGGSLRHSICDSTRLTTTRGSLWCSAWQTLGALAISVPPSTKLAQLRRND